MKKTLSIITGIFLICLLGGCWNELPELGGNTVGNVTFTVDGNTERTLRPASINTGAFERIELEISNNSGAVVSLIFNKGETSKTTTLEQGTWNVSAKGFMKIGDAVYEAAQGNSSVTVGSGSTSASVQLQTGIFGGAPGVFSYTVVFPANANAVLELSPLNDIYGHGNPNAGKTLQFSATQIGSIEVSPGYYLLSITARAADKMGIWNELVHIYSGQETSMSHTFESGDLTGSVILGGTLSVGELEGNRVQRAVITAFGDINHVNRIAGVEVSGLAQTGAVYSGEWSMTIPESLIGKALYMLIEETITGPGGTRTYTRNVRGGDSPVSFTVPQGGDTDIHLEASYTWGQWVAAGGGITDESAMTHEVQADGIIKVTTTQNIDNDWEKWQLGLYYYYPAEIDIAYAYEFEAWTESGELDMDVLYVDYYLDIYGTPASVLETIPINTARQTFTFISTRRINSDVDPAVKFNVGSKSFIGAFFIKIKAVKPSSEFIPPPQGGGERFTATPVDNGIKLSVDLTGLPDNAEALAFLVHENGSMFTMAWRDLIYNGEPRPDSYEMIFPYVDAGKQYTFELQWQGNTTFHMASIVHEPVTATNGRGELKFDNESELALIQEGSYLKLNKTPELALFGETNITEERYLYNVVSGTSWDDPYAQWRFETLLPPNLLEPVDLLDTSILPGWYEPKDFSAVTSTTCFSDFFYQFDYKADDIYLSTNDKRLYGYFQTLGISSTPYVYPNAVSDTFTAETHAEGVKLTVDLSLIPETVDSLIFYPEDWSSQCYIDINDVKNAADAENKFSLIYPFVQSGKAYNFEVSYEGTGTVGKAAATAGEGIGELSISNFGNIGITYSSNAKTISLTGTPETPSLSGSGNIELQRWEWAFWKGYNFDNCEWAGAIREEILKTSFAFDDTFNMAIRVMLSNNWAYITLQYIVRYGGYNFQSESIRSQPFMFPEIIDADAVGEGVIRTAFQTNSYLRIEYLGNVSTEMFARIYSTGEDWYTHEPVVTYLWYIDGELQSYTEEEIRFPTTELDSGMHYGLAVIIIDGVPFSQEFAFRVEK